MRPFAVRWALVIALAGAGVVSCGGEKPPPTAAKKAEIGVSWADVFDGTPDFYAVVRPKAIKRDGLYGEFFKSLVRAAQSKTRARGDTMVAAVEGADEIIVGLERGHDAAIVLRGVPASLDPQRITDAEGSSLFRLTSERGKVVEYELVDRKSTDTGALFVLPDRTWVGALGEARDRARQAFQTPANRPAPRLDREALAVVRIAGPLVRMFDRHPVFGPIAKKLMSATFALKPAKGGLVVSLAYADTDAAAWAEMESKRLIAELTKDDKRAWLKDAQVQYEGSTVFVRVAVPPRLLDELPNASGNDLGL